MSNTHPVFVPNDTMDSRKDTAVLLVGTARESGIHQRSIRTGQGGFWVTQELADVIYDGVDVESEPGAEVSGNEPEPEQPKAEEKATKKTSGNRAAKNKPTEE